MTDRAPNGYLGKHSITGGRVEYDWVSINMTYGEGFAIDFNIRVFGYLGKGETELILKK